jgi:uncharacterized membrane protein
MDLSLPARTQWMLTIAGSVSAIAVGLRASHVISTGWFLAVVFAVVIPLATLKVFADFRRR